MCYKENGDQSRNNPGSFEITLFLALHCYMDISNIISSQSEEQASVSVSRIVNDLDSLTELLRRFVQVGDHSFDEDKQLLDFFLQYKNTNDLVFYALKSIQKDSALCRQEFSSLLDSTGCFLSYVSNHQEQIGALEFKTNCQKYISPFEDAHKQSVSYSNACWSAAQEIANKLDYLDERADNYEELTRILNDRESKHKAAHAKVEETYSILQEKQKDVFALFSFEFNMLQIVVDKLRQISLSVINDLNNLGKGGCVHE